MATSRLSSRFDVAVFPIPDAVLFPGTTLPLHIFEERYGRMLEDLKSKGWPLAISLVEPDGTNAHEYRLNTICGAGDVQVFKEYGDGRSDILVHGVQRVRLLTFVQREPYLIMEAETIEEGISASSEVEELRSMIQAWSFINPDIPDDLSLLFEEYGALGELCDFFVFHFIRKVNEKQLYLNCADPRLRADRLFEYLRKDLQRQAKRQLKTKQGLVLH